MKFLFAFVFALFSFASIYGSGIEGRLSDKDDNPIIGAYIIQLNSEEHAHSNEFGKFYLKKVAVGDTLQVVHLGYKTLIYVIQDSDKSIEITMEEANFELSEILVGQNRKQVNIISAIDVEVSPVNSSQEILRKVPGLIIGQHAGGGKAEQIFLRGFDIDHGTDIAIAVDGMPVNMVSHAHGQGYADLHFIIPETIEKIDFGKGPYYADKGNFGTAGYVDFKTKDRLDKSVIGLEYGSFNTMRAMTMLNLVDTKNHNVYFAGEYLLSDGPFESSQHFSRNNLFAKYTGTINGTDKISVLASHFTSKWDASGQIPQRAVDQGLITRFGAIDDTEGGYTSRTNVAFSYTKAIDEKTFTKTNAYFSKYDFELFSNFTFFLEDPENADQIRQFEDRSLFGLESSINRTMSYDNFSSQWQLGVGLRSDNIDNNQLSRTKNRNELLERIQFGDVDESNLYTFLNVDLDFGDLLVQPGVRVDFFQFNYVDNLAPTYDRLSDTDTQISPKLNLIYNLDDNVQLFAKTGIGFHSNDSRVVLDGAGRAALPPAYGADLGAIIKPGKRIFMNVALWYLFLEQEFVYVGDAGIVEPSGRTRRIGIDVGTRFQINDWLYANADFNYARPRSIDEPEGGQFIPLAPTVTATGGLSMQKGDLKANLQMRYVKDRPANEDNSIVAEGYFITDLSTTYAFGPVSVGVNIENLFDRDWNETQFATESRLFNEPTSVEEIHFTPGTPFAIRGIVKYNF